MTDGLYATGADPYIDPATGILRNKLTLTTQAELDAAESDIASLEIVDLTVENIPILRGITIDTLKAIHHQIFKNIFSWAGEFRTINIAKDSTKFCEYQHIATEGKRIFDELVAENLLYTISDHTHYIKRLAYYYSELNMLHPFREGNGRTLRTLMSILAMNNGGNIIAWDRMDPQENIEACAHAAYHDESKIERMLAKIVEFA